MYRINYVGRPVLITVDEVIEKAAIMQDADIRFISNSIEVAEERWIAPALGDALYEAMIAAKNVVVTEGNKTTLLANINASRAAAGKNPVQAGELRAGMLVNAIELCSQEYKTLWERYLWKICAEAVDIAAQVPSWLRTTAQGQQLNAPQGIGGVTEGSASGDRREMQFKQDHMIEGRLLPLIERMKKWLCEHTNWYPEWEDCGCSKKDGISERHGGIILGIYDEEPSREPVRVTTTAAPAPRMQACQLKLSIVEEPDPTVLYMLCNLNTIPKQYPAGNTLTVPHLVGKQVNWPVWIGNTPYMDMPLNETTMTFDNTEYGGFPAGEKVLIDYIERVG